MNIRIILILVLLLACRAVMAGDIPAAGKRIAVLEFSAVNADDSYAKALRNKIEIALYEKKLNVIEQKQMSRILFETGNVHTCRESNCAINQGKIVSAEYVVVGEVTFAGEYIITVRIVDVANGRIVFANSASVKAKDDILAESQKVADALSTSLGKKLKKDMVVEDTAIKKNGDDGAAKMPRPQTPAVFTGDASLQGGYLLPMAFLWKKASGGFNISATGGIVIRNYFIGLKTGFFRLYKRDHEPFSSIIPLLARFDYNVNVSNMFISPSLALGVSYNMIHETGVRVFEMVVNPGIAVGYRFTKLFRLFVSADYYCIIERERGIQFMTFGAGMGFSF